MLINSFLSFNCITFFTINEFLLFILLINKQLMNGEIYKFNSILIIFQFIQHGRYKYYVKCNVGE